MFRSHRPSHSYKIPFLFITFKIAMRRRALILLFPFTLFFTETVVFPMEINTRCKKISSTRMMKDMNCPHKKGKCEKPDGTCNNSSPCSVCPVCSIFSFQPLYSLTVQKNIPKKKYQLLNSALISFYSSDIWKPPNNYLLYA